MRLIERLTSSGSAERASLSWQDYQSFFGFNGSAYQLPQTLAGVAGESIPTNFTSYVSQAYQRNGVVFACVLSRALVFSEARFKFRRLNNGQYGRLFGSSELAVLENPYPNGSTGELLFRMEQDASMAGNAFLLRRRVGTRREDRIHRLRPDWVTIMLGSPSDSVNAEDGPEGGADVEVVGYSYGAPNREPVFFGVDEVAHYCPLPDPLASFRGMSWITPILREIDADSAATDHKAAFFRNGATPNAVVTLNERVSPENFERFKNLMESEHRGAANAYKTLYLGGGADMKVVGSTFEQMSFRATQGAGETRIAAAAGVPPIIVGLSEGLESATYSNYGMARRKFADHWARPHWRMAAQALSKLIDVPAGAELWYDETDIAFLQEDVLDRAEIQSRRATTIEALVRAGFDPDSAVAAVNADDFGLLTHTGLYSVQLQPPMPDGATSNG